MVEARGLEPPTDEGPSRAGSGFSHCTAGLDFDAYAADAMVRAAVERQLEIIGEALGQLAKLDPEIAGGISEHRRIIAFRNILVHGYADVDHVLVWDMVSTRLPDLRREVEGLLGAG